MKEKDPIPQTQPSGNQPPPRPPKYTAIAANPDDDDDNARARKSNKDASRINLPPKSSSAPTIKLPTFSPGQSAVDCAKPAKKAKNHTLVTAMTRAPRRVAYNVELGMILAAVLALNGMLYVLCRL